MDNNKLIIIGAILVLLIGGVILVDVNITPSDPKATAKDDKDTVVLKSSAPGNKTDAEVILEGAKFAKETYDELHENKLKKDSVRNANRKRIWVYQVGLPSNDNLKILENYNKLNNISNVKIFRSGRKSFFIYKDDGYTEQQLRDSLKIFQSKLAIAGIESRIDVVDLMSLCSRKEEVVRGENLRIKKEGVELLCYTCE